MSGSDPNKSQLYGLSESVCVGRRKQRGKVTVCIPPYWMCVHTVCLFYIYYVSVCTFIEADLVSQYNHAFSEQLVLKVLSEEGAQLRLEQLPAKKDMSACTDTAHTPSIIPPKHEPKLISSLALESCQCLTGSRFRKWEKMLFTLNKKATTETFEHINKRIFRW